MTTSIHIRLPQETMDKLDELSKETYASKSALIRRAIDELIKKLQPEN